LPPPEAGSILPVSQAAADPSFPKYRTMATDKLVPYANNARTHSKAQIAKIAASIKEFGFTNPVLTDGKRGIIAGHGRVLAAQMLDMVSVPIIELSHLSVAQRRAYILADNRLALDAGWDDELLALELGALRADGFDLSLTGFDFNEIGMLLGSSEGLTDPDDAPPAPSQPVSIAGDVWLLGGHRLACGDSTDARVVAAALGGAKPHLMVTDPPYGVGYDANWRNERVRQDGSPVGGRAVGKVANDGDADWREAWALFPGSVAYVWHAGLHGEQVISSLVANGFRIRAQIIWVKTRAVISRGHYHWQHEPALYSVREGEDDQWRFVPEHEVVDYSVREGETGQWQGGRKQSTVWNIEHIKSETGHSTQKPVECMRRPIENNSSPGHAVYDPFAGSGTTIIAAEMTGRACHAIELSPAYVDVAILRWQAFTGKDAVHGEDGRTFASIGLERSVPPQAARTRTRVKVEA
jgi:DNA modification methylase